MRLKWLRGLSRLQRSLLAPARRQKWRHVAYSCCLVIRPRYSRRRLHYYCTTSLERASAGMLTRALLTARPRTTAGRVTTPLSRVYPRLHTEFALLYCEYITTASLPQRHLSARLPRSRARHRGYKESWGGYSASVHSHPQCRQDFSTECSAETNSIPRAAKTSTQT